MITITEDRQRTQVQTTSIVLAVEDVMAVAVVLVAVGIAVPVGLAVPGDMAEHGVTVDLTMEDLTMEDLIMAITSHPIMDILAGHHMVLPAVHGALVAAAAGAHGDEGASSAARQVVSILLPSQPSSGTSSPTLRTAMATRPPTMTKTTPPTPTFSIPSPRSSFTFPYLAQRKKM